MSYNDFEKNFPRHTIEILEKYFSKEPHNVTLLINCMVGLLILPQEKFFKNNTFLKKLPEEIPPDWGLTREHVKQVQCSARGYKLENIVRHMRNAVAHMKIKTMQEVIMKSKKLHSRTYPTLNWKSLSPT